MVEIFCGKDFRSEFLWYGFSLVWLQMYPVVIFETTKDERKKLIIIVGLLINRVSVELIDLPYYNGIKNRKLP